MIRDEAALLNERSMVVDSPLNFRHRAIQLPAFVDLEPWYAACQYGARPNPDSHEHSGYLVA